MLGRLNVRDNVHVQCLERELRNFLYCLVGKPAKFVLPSCVVTIIVTNYRPGFRILTFFYRAQARMEFSSAIKDRTVITRDTNFRIERRNEEEGSEFST